MENLRERRKKRDVSGSHSETRVALRRDVGTSLILALAIKDVGSQRGIVLLVDLFPLSSCTNLVPRTRFLYIDILMVPDNKICVGELAGSCGDRTKGEGDRRASYWSIETKRVNKEFNFRGSRASHDHRDQWGYEAFLRRRRDACEVKTELNYGWEHRYSRTPRASSIGSYFFFSKIIGCGRTPLKGAKETSSLDTAIASVPR